MANFPSTIPFRYPLSRSVRVPSQVIEFVDGSEQRWRTAVPLNSFQIQLQKLPWTDVQTVQNWFATVKGSYDTGNLTIGGETFSTVGLETDSLSIQEDDDFPGLFVIALQFRQTAPSGSWPTVTAMYPPINGGIITQYPFTMAPRFLTTRNDLPSGPRYTYSEWTANKMAWICSYPAVTASEMLTLMQFAVAMGGRFRHFTFVDPQTGITYHNARLDTDSVDVEYVQAGQCSLTLPVYAFGAG